MKKLLLLFVVSLSFGQTPNYFYTYLTTGVSSTDTVFYFTQSDTSYISTNTNYYGTIFDTWYANAAEAYKANKAEAIRINTRNGRTLNVTRAQFGTTARSFNTSGRRYKISIDVLSAQLIPFVSASTSGLYLYNDGTNTSWASVGAGSAMTKAQIVDTLNNTGVTSAIDFSGNTISATGLTLTGAIIGAASQSVFNTVSTTVNAFGAATALTLGATTGTTTIRNATTFNNANTYFGVSGAIGTINLWDNVSVAYNTIYSSDGVLNLGGMLISTATWNGTTIGATFGGTGLTTYTQGDLIYSSASNTLAKLAKDANATRYLSNTGASNNPAWAQVALATGVSGTLPFGNLDTLTRNLSLATDNDRIRDSVIMATKLFIVDSAIVGVGYGLDRTVASHTQTITVDTTNEIATLFDVSQKINITDSTIVGVGYGLDRTVSNHTQTVTVDTTNEIATLYDVSQVSGSAMTKAQIEDTLNNTGVNSTIALTSQTVSANTFLAADSVRATKSLRTGLSNVSDGVLNFYNATNAFYTQISLSTPSANRTISTPNVSGTLLTLDGGQNATNIGTITSGAITSTGIHITDSLRVNGSARIGTATQYAERLTVQNGLLVNAMSIKNSRNTTILNVDSSGYITTGGFPVVISIPIDSSYLNTTDTVIVGSFPYAMTIDSVKFVNQATAANLTYKVGYGTNIKTFTLIVTLGTASTSVTIGDKVTAFDNSSPPANSYFAVLVSSVTTKPKRSVVTIFGHR